MLKVNSFSSVSLAELEQVNASWDMAKTNTN